MLGAAPLGREKGMAKNEKSPLTGEKKEVLSPRAKRNLILVLVNTVVFFAVYRTLIYYGELTDDTFGAFLAMILYGALLLGFVLAYLIYNRFLYRRGITVDMLPDSMTREEKEAFVADGEARLEKSRWMMTVILPLVITFLLDALQLFIIEPFFGG